MLDGQQKDIRKMSEEEFVEAFEMLKGKTKDWTELKPELLIEDSRYLFIVRCGLGLSQREFAKLIEVDRDAIRAIESGRRRLVHLGPARRWTSRIETVFTKMVPSIDIAITKVIEYKRCTDGFDFIEKDKPITKLTEKELFSIFEKTKEITKDFTHFGPKVFMESPQSLLILRLLLGLSHDKFARILGADDRDLRGREKGSESIGMEIAIRLSRKIQEIFQGSRIKADYEIVLYYFKIFRSFLHDDLQKDMKRGLEFAKSQKLSEIEDDIKTILELSRVDFYLHPIIQGLKRELCVDFAIPSEDKPKYIIEAFSFSLHKPLGQSLKRVRETDHRFRMIKLKQPQIKTIMCIKFTDKDIPIKRIKELVELDLLDTDILLVCDEIQRLSEILG